MSDQRSERRPYLRYFLLVLILFGVYMLLHPFQDDSSATLAPNLVFNR
jgi:hypothetical protein